MKLAAFEIKNFRSISKTQRLAVGDLSILVGPNNEGKSNIMRAIALAMAQLGVDVAGELDWVRSSRRYPLGLRSSLRSQYQWERDFPVDAQEDGGFTTLRVEFGLSDADILAFHEKFGVRLKANLRLRVTLGQDDMRQLDILLPGPGKAKLAGKTRLVCEFIRERIAFTYIPAVRRSDTATDLINWMLTQRLSTIVEQPEYRKLVRDAKELLQPVQRELEAEIQATLSHFVPSVSQVLVGVEADAPFELVGRPTLLVNDGVETDLRYKGDGVQSLVALSMLQHVSKSTLTGRHLVLAIEEPEAHLHPDAIHAIAAVVRKLSEEHQIILTTHSPILVDRSDRARNIVVSAGAVATAPKISDVRQSLGVRVSDNLSTAELVLIVEGEEDAKVLRPWLTSDSRRLAHALRTGRLVIDPMGGAGNLSYKASLYKHLLCRVVALVDDDHSGRPAVQKALDDGVISVSDVFLTKRGGQNLSELEDMFRKDLYEVELGDAFGVKLIDKWFKNPNEAWSERLERCFKACGKPWNPAIETRVKDRVAELAAARGSTCLCETSSTVYQAVVARLEAVLGRAV